MNFSVLPEFLAIGGLVLAFGALLNRAPETRLRYWLVGWVLVLAHIVAQFVGQNSPEPIATAAMLASLAMLLFTSGAFIWASNDMRRRTSPGDLSMILLATTPDALMYGCVVYGVTSMTVYGVLSLAGLAASVWWFCGGRRLADRPERIVRAIMLVLAYAVQYWLLHDQRMGMAINWSLFWHFLATAAFFYVATRHPGIGVRFTVLSFLAWAMVFPLGVAMRLFWPHVSVEHEVWNLPKFLVATGLIFTLLEEQITKAEHASLHDELTGLSNRRLFMRRLQETVKGQGGSGLTGVMVIDLDGFKQVNDAHGHAIGDDLLREIAARFSACVRRGDTLARLGGDEFAVILPGVPDRATVKEVARKLQDSLQPAFRIKGNDLRVQASIGVALYPEDAKDEAWLYAQADRDMYRHKPDQRPVAASSS